MSAGRLSFGFVALTLSCAATALAREASPPGQPEARPDDDTEPSVEVLPSDVPPPPAQALPIAPPPAQAVAPPVPVAPFGFAGQFTLSDDLQLGATEISYVSPGQGTTRTTLQLRPAFDAFVAANFSLGAQAIIGYTGVGGANSSHRTALGLLGRIGYNFTIGPTTSIWLRVGVGYEPPGTQAPVIPGLSEKNVSVQVYLPIVYRPVPRFFIAGGPIVTTQVVEKVNDADAPKSTFIGLQSTIGTCFRAM